MIVTRWADFAQFSSEKMTKVDVARGETLFGGLNCFAAGQAHTAHAHADQDKIYIVLDGQAEICVGDAKQLVSAGGGAFAPAGVIHSIRNCNEELLVVLAILAPPPHR